MQRDVTITSSRSQLLNQSARSRSPAPLHFEQMGVGIGLVYNSEISICHIFTSNSISPQLKKSCGITNKEAQVLKGFEFHQMESKSNMLELAPHVDL